MARRLGRPRALALLHLEGRILDVRERGRTLDLVLDDFVAGYLLDWCGFAGEARWTLSLKGCRKVEWLLDDWSLARKRRGAPLLRPATAEEMIADRGFSARTWSDMDSGAGYHVDRGWVLNLRNPLKWAGCLEGMGDSFLVVECDRAVVIDEREDAMRRIGGEEMAVVWRRYLADATERGYPHPPEWLDAQGIPDQSLKLRGSG
jgi:hypothetical protein